MIDPSKIQNMLPANLKLTNVRIYGSDVPMPKLLFNSYDVESQWMRGHRFNYAITEQKTIHIILSC